MVQSDQDRGGGGSGSRPDQVLRYLGVVFEAAGTSVAVFLRKNFGSRYLGVRAAAAIPLMLCYAALWTGNTARESPAPMLFFLVAYLAMCLLHRGRGGMAQRLGEGGHSQYSGEPLLLRLLPASESTVKRLFEPLLCLVVGCFVLPASAALGSYLMLAGFCLMGSGSLQHGHERARDRRMNDAVIEQQQLVERFRGSGGN